MLLLSKFIIFSTLLISFAFASIAPLNTRVRTAQGLLVRDHRTEDKINVLLFGDAGKANINQYRIGNQMFQTCQKHGCSFAISLGDNIYPSGVENTKDDKFQKAFEQPYRKFSLNAPLDFWMVLGNHDWRGNTQAQIDYSFQSRIWRMLNNHFTIPYLPNWLHIYALDTTNIYGSKWYDIFRNRNLLKKFRMQLDGARKALCDKPGWKILIAHHPIYSTGREKNIGKEAKLRKLILPFMRECKIDLYLAGHEHHLEYIETSEQHDTIISGAAAGARDTPERRMDTTSAKSVFRAIQMGFVRLEITPSEVKTLYYNSHGEVLSTFRKHKQ